MEHDLLSPRQLAQAIGVSESSVKRWVDDGRIEAHKTEGGHRRILRSVAVRYIRETGTPVLRPDVLGLPHREQPATMAPDEVEELLLGYLERGSEAESHALLVSTWVGGASIGDLADGPVRGAMEALGRLWKSRGDGVAVEHRATEIVLQCLHLLRSLIPEPAAGALSAVGGAPDVYRLPTLLAACVLAEEGVRAVNLGPQTPLSVVADQAEREDASLVWWSVSHVGTESPDACREIVRRLDRRGIAVILGGREHEKLALGSRTPAVRGDSMKELAAFARGLKRRS